MRIKPLVLRINRFAVVLIQHQSSSDRHIYKDSYSANGILTWSLASATNSADNPALHLSAMTKLDTSLLPS